MFTKVTLWNFRSFEKIEFDLSKSNNTAKRLAVVYGENGAGKSNLMSAFVLINELMNTMNVRDSYERFLNQKAIFADESLDKALRQEILAGIRDMPAIISDYKMVDSDKPIAAQYEFSLSGITGMYTVEFDNSEITHEHLEYLLNQRRGVYFDCSADKIAINNGILDNKALLSDIKESAKRFWGKHSLLAIILHELADKAKSYGEDSISPNFAKVLDAFLTLSCMVKIGNRQWEKMPASSGVLTAPEQGTIARVYESQLDIAEHLFTKLFSAINSEISEVSYKREYSEKNLHYQMYIKKKIAGAVRLLDFQKESTGTHQVLRAVCYLLSACMGKTIVLDEADSGIHDILFQKIIQEVSPYITGQVIVSTHNTMLMLADFARDATYILSEEDNGNRIVRCVSDSERRIYLNNNVRSKYLNNEYGGLPEVKPIDFESLIKYLKDESFGTLSEIIKASG